MTPASAKAKGRRFQQDVVAMILELHPELEPDDVQSRSMGSNGEDIVLSPAARRLFPYAVECKHHKSFKGIYDLIAQAQANARSHEPLVVLKQDRAQPLAILHAAHLFALLARLKGKP